jgi:Zn-dependent metalloprotease
VNQKEVNRKGVNNKSVNNKNVNRRNGRLMKKITALILSVTIMLPCMPVQGVETAQAGVFTDIAASWAQNELQYFAEQGWIKGYPDGTLRPDRKITRAEFTAIINNAFAYIEAAEQCVFADVYPADWYYRTVLIAVRQGYIKGTSAQTFAPDDNISRHEAAVILARLLNMDNGEYKSAIRHFTDAQDIPEWASGGVGALTAQKIVVGYPDGTFSGGNFLTRAEAAALIRRAYDAVSNAAGKEIPPPGKDAAQPLAGVNWVDNVQAAMTEFVAGSEIELEIACNKEAEISWSVTQGELLGELTGSKVWWRLPDTKGQYTVTVRVRDGKKSTSLSRTVKVIPYTPCGDAIADITALNGGVAPIMSYDTAVGIPSMLIGRYSPKKIYTAEDAIASLNDIKELMNMENPEEEFKILKTECVDNMPIYVLQQVYKGIPVDGGQISIDVDSIYNVQSVGGSYYPDVRLSELSVEPTISESEAQAIVENDLAATGNYPEDSPEFNSTTLIVDMVHSENPELAWGINVEIGGETWEYYIHSQSGKIIDKYLMSPLFYNEDDIDTTSTLQNGEIINVVKVTEPNDDVYYVLHDRKRNIQVFDMKSQGFVTDGLINPPKFDENPTPAWPGEIVKDNNNIWDFLNTVSKPHRDALYAFINFSKVYDFFSKAYNRNSIDGNGKEIKVSVNVGFGLPQSVSNAYWLPNKEQFVIGNMDDNAKALDVLGHEYTHAIAYYAIQDHNGKGFKNTAYSESAAISEAIPDILGALVEASVKGYAVDNDNFYKCGEDSGRIVRDMSAVKVNHLSKFIKTGDAATAMYSNSGVLSTAFYKITSDPNGIKDIELLSHVWYNVLLKLKRDSKFKDCREQFFRSIYKYQHHITESNEKKYSISNEQIEAVKKVFDDVGITDDVSDTAWYAPVIKKAKDKKIIFGYTDGNIKPENSVTRAEFLVMALRAAKIVLPEEQLTDHELTNHWAGSEVTFAAQQKWVSDCWLDSTYIEKPITRAEACNVAFRVMNTQYQLTRVQLYKYVNGQRSEKGEIWGTDKFNDFISGLDIVRPNDPNQLVRAAQEKLNWQGYQLEVDGVFGHDTINALRNFQKDAGLEQTGMIDDITWEALNYFGMYQLFINGCIEGTLDDDILYLMPWRNLNRAEACKILVSPLT